MANAFLNYKQLLMDAGELSPRTWAGYKIAAEALVAHMGRTRIVADLDPQDFASLRKHRRRPVWSAALGDSA